MSLRINFQRLTSDKSLAITLFVILAAILLFLYFALTFKYFD
jgi:hypothetical protein